LNPHRGKILYIDLAESKVWKDNLPIDLSLRLLGGRGINAILLWRLVKPEVDPLGPDNVLIFGVGALTGTSAPCAGRTTVTCKAPLTGLYLKSSMGGHWGAELKFAGYNHIIVRGSAKKPVFLWINDDDVRIMDAVHLWGKDVRQTDRDIKAEIGDWDAKVACIGPAGENLVRISAIMSSVYHSAARGGCGAVMGSKNLKAIAVRGTGEIKIADPESFHDSASAAREAIVKDSAWRGFYQYGTSGGVQFTNELHRLPAYNFTRCHIDEIWPLTGQCLVKDGYLKRRIGCFGCVISCHRFTTVDEGPYKGSYSGGPEYETLVALGAMTGVIDTEAVLRANELCNLMGLDTISTGSVIAWAIESSQRGSLSSENAEGPTLKYGSAEVLMKLIPMIAKRKGRIGDLLAEGVKRAAERTGGDSLQWAMCNSKGLEQSMVYTISSKAYALAFAVNPRGPDHLHTECTAEKGGSPEGIYLIEKITGDKRYASPYLTEYRAEIVRWHEDCYAATDALGFCAFASTATYGVTPSSMAEMFKLATGIEMSEETLMLAGRRIVTLEKCYNTREGADRKIDDLPWRLMHEPAPTGPGKGTMNSPEELTIMLDRYYTLHNWDVKTGRPYGKTLQMLNLEDVKEELERLGKLP
jgi:aldehyde:ferredoxin oxidoreductase